MFTKTMEKFKNAWPETAVGLASIVAGILLLLFSAIAVASPEGAQAGAKKDGTFRVVGTYLKPSPFATLVANFTRTQAGHGVTVDSSYGTASRQLAELTGGGSADVVGFDLSADVDQLAQAGVVASSWS